MPSSYELTGKHLIKGEWIVSNGAEFAAVNPKTGERLSGGFREASLNEANAALDAAAGAFAAIADLTDTRRADLLDAIADSIQSRASALFERAGEETALPEGRLKGELTRTTNQLRLFAGVVREGSWVDAVIDTADPTRQPMPKPDIRRMLRPLGPVVVFDASNFPFAFGPCGGDTASALAAGCPVIVKSHPGHPGTNELFADAVREALVTTEMPVGLFSLLQSSGTQIGELLVKHPATEAVAFTGSQRAGRTLFTLAAARPRPIPVYAEMGSLNPVVLLPGALADRADAIAEGVAASVSGSGGQLCTKPGVVLYVEDQSARAFVEVLAGKLTAVPSTTLLYSGLQRRFYRTLEQMRAITEVEAKVAGKVSGNADAAPSLLTVDAETFRTSPELKEEAFGPATILVRCADCADLEATVATLGGQLTGTIHTGHSDSPDTIGRIAGALESRVGRLLFNGYPTGVEVCAAMVHGGPYPATTAANSTSVGTLAIVRFARPVAFQNAPEAVLPPALKSANPLGIVRKVNGGLTKEAVD